VVHRVEQDRSVQEQLDWSFDLDDSPLNAGPTCRLTIWYSSLNAKNNFLYSVISVL